MTKGERIRLAREKQGMNAVELAERLGISKQRLYKYEHGVVNNIPQNLIESAARILGTTPAYIMGWDEISVAVLPPENIFMRPIYDSAAAGFNVLAQDCITGYMPTYISSPSEQEDYIWVHVVGDSMSPMIEDGDKVLVRRQTSVDSGKIAIVFVDNEEAVIKRVNYGDSWIELISVNPYYPPRRFEGADVQRVFVFGLVKEINKTLN